MITYYELQKNQNYMKYKIIIVAILILMGNQKTFSQNVYIRGKIIDYETNYAIHAVTIVPDSLPNGALSDMNGNFDIKGNTRKLELSFVGYYPIRFINIPVEKKHIDFGNIKMVANHLGEDVATGKPYTISEQSKEEDKRLRKNVLKKYRIKVCGKKLKPYFEGNKLIFDFNKNGGK